MNSRKTGVILSYVMMIFEVLSTLLLTPFILRTLGQAEYGVYKLSVAIGSYLLLLDLGMGNATTRYISKYRATNDITQGRQFLGVTTIYYSIIAAISIVAGIVLVVLFPTVFAKGLSVTEVELAQKLLSITMINAAITLGTSAYPHVIVAYEKFAFSKGLSIVQIIIRMMITFIALKMGAGSIGIVGINLFLTVINRAIFVWYVLYKIKLKPLFSNTEFTYIKEIFAYSSLILIQMVSTHINVFAGQVLLGMFVASSSVIIAMYGIGTQIVQYFQSIGESFTGVLMPGVVRIVEKKSTPEQLCDEMIRIGRIIFMILSFIWICFILYGKQFVFLWAGDDNIQAYYVAVILMSAYLVILSQTIGSQILWAMNSHKEQALTKFFTVIINVIFTVFLIQWNPLIGATIGTFISLFFGDIVIKNIIFKKKINISLKRYYKGILKGIMPCLVISFFCGFAFRYINLSGWGGFLCNIVVISIIYIICMWLIGMNNYEKGIIISILKKHKKNPKM